MRPIDADAVIDYQRKSMETVYGRYAEMLKDHLDIDDALSIPIHAMEAYSRGKQFFLGLKGILDAAPTVDAVPISALLELRDSLYFADQITMNGLKMLNRLIAKYESGRKNDWVQVVRCRECTHYRIFMGRDMCAKNAAVLDGHEAGLRATGADNFCSYGERKEQNV